jgi:molybdopterin converting factor small subunit
MKVELNLYATLAKFLPEKVKQAGGVIEVEDGLTVDQLMRYLNVPDDYVKLVFIDGVHAGKDSVLQDGNRLGVFPPVGGG